MRMIIRLNEYRTGTYEMNRFKAYLVSLVIFCLFLTGCQKLTIPENVKPIENFQVERYLGKWFEIARLDHSFERGLTNISAEYSLRKGGGINVLNRGFNSKKDRWKEAEGKAFFVKDTKTGFLKVSFFGPFYGAYIIADLDVDYQYALISGPDKSYLWILSRTPKIAENQLNRLIQKAKKLGFETKNLIIVPHDKVG